MNKEAEVNISVKKLNKRKRKQLSIKPRKQERFKDRIQTNNVSETSVKTDDVSHYLLKAADSSTTVHEFMNEGKKICKHISFESKNTEKRKSFQENVELLLDACKAHSQIRDKTFYCNKIEDLHKNHIKVLLKKRDKLNIEIEQAQIKQRINKNLIYKRLRRIGKVLHNLAALNKFSGLKMNKFLGKKEKNIQVIKSKLGQSVCCEKFHSALNKLNQKEEKIIANKNNISERLVQTKIKLIAVKNMLKEKFNTFQQYSYDEQESNLEISKLKDVNKYETHLTQIQDNWEIFYTELLDEINIIQYSLENNVSVKSLMVETESDKAQKDTDYRNNFSKPALPDPKGIINVNKANKDTVFCEQVTLMQCQPQAFCKENCSSEIQETFNMQEKNKTEISRLQNLLAVTRQELENVKKKLHSKIKIIQKCSNQKKQMREQFNKAKKDQKILQNQLVQTQNELEAVQNLNDDEVQIIEQKDIKLGVVQEVGLLGSQLKGILKKTLDSHIQIDINHQKVQQEQKIMEQLNKVEEDKKILQNLLTQTQNELEDCKKKLKNKVHIVQQRKLHEQIEIELSQSKEVALLNQLIETQHELEETKKDLGNKVITIQQMTQHEQKVTKELNKTEEDIKLLHSQLTATLHELETVQKESNDRVHIIHQEQIEKAMEPVFSNIQLMLITKLGFTDQNRHHFENYMKEGGCRGIVSDIRRLIEDKVQSQDENIPEAVSGSNILTVTENELHLLILIASILKAVQFSASIDLIYSFVSEVDNVISRQHVENLLKKFPTLFQEESAGGGSSNTNWRCLYLKPMITL